MNNLPLPIPDAIPLCQMTLHKMPFAPNNELLLYVLDKFQEGGSHILIVSQFGIDMAKSSKMAINAGPTSHSPDGGNIKTILVQAERGSWEGKAVSPGVGLAFIGRRKQWCKTWPGTG